MEQKEKETKSAFALFIKLYISRRKLTQHKGNFLLLEATKSWITLSHEEKQIFIKKFYECKVKRRNKFGERLKHTQPCMKKKIHRNNRIPQHDNDFNQSCSNEDKPEDMTQEMDFGLNQSNESCSITTIGTESRVDHSLLPTTALTDSTQYDESKDEEYPTPILTEPIPVQAKTSKELFELIKSKVGADNVLWSSLSCSHKKNYQKALYQLKKEYITNYKTYLESLSPKELFQYYHKFKH